MIIACAFQVESPYIASYRLVEDEHYVVVAVLLRPVFGRAQRDAALASIADDVARQTDKEVWVTADLDIWSKCASLEASELVKVLRTRV